MVFAYADVAERLGTIQPVMYPGGFDGLIKMEGASNWRQRCIRAFSEIEPSPTIRAAFATRFYVGLRSR